MEVCAEGGVIAQKLANRIADDGGAALIVDYGHDGTKTDTFRVSAMMVTSLAFSQSLSTSIPNSLYCKLVRLVSSA